MVYSMVVLLEGEMVYELVGYLVGLLVHKLVENSVAWMAGLSV